MSYRSNVAIRIYSEIDSVEGTMVEFGEFYSSTFDALDPEIQKDILDLETDSNNATGNKDLFFLSDEYGLEFLFVANDVEWYETNLAVQFFQRMIFKAHRLNLNVEHIMIGQDITDIEIFQEGPSCEYRLGVHTKIDLG